MIVVSDRSRSKMHLRPANGMDNDRSKSSVSFQNAFETK